MWSGIPVKLTFGPTRKFCFNAYVNGPGYSLHWGCIPFQHFTSWICFLSICQVCSRSFTILSPTPIDHRIVTHVSCVVSLLQLKYWEAITNAGMGLWRLFVFRSYIDLWYLRFRVLRRLEFNARKIFHGYQKLALNMINGVCFSCFRWIIFIVILASILDGCGLG